MQQITGLKVMQDIANKMGYKLIKKTTSNPKPILPKLDKEYKDMDSKTLQIELKGIDSQIAKMKADNQNVHEKVVEFMNSEPVQEHMKTLFMNNKINPSKVQMHNNELNLTNNLRGYVSELFSLAMETELRAKFVALNPDLGKIIDEVHNISMEDTPSGKILKVEMKKVDKKPTTTTEETKNEV